MNFVTKKIKAKFLSAVHGERNRVENALFRHRKHKHAHFSAYLFDGLAFLP